MVQILYSSLLPPSPSSLLPSFPLTPFSALSETFPPDPTTSSQPLKLHSSDIFITYMLGNTSSLPPKPVHNFPKTPRAVIEPTLRILEYRAQWRDILRTPDGGEEVPCGVGTVLCGGVVVLDVLVCLFIKP